jgi:hypothetical protein
MSSAITHSLYGSLWSVRVVTQFLQILLNQLLRCSRVFPSLSRDRLVLGPGYGHCRRIEVVVALDDLPSGIALRHVVDVKLVAYRRPRLQVLEQTDLVGLNRRRSYRSDRDEEAGERCAVRKDNGYPCAERSCEGVIQGPPAEVGAELAGARADIWADRAGAPPDIELVLRTAESGFVGRAPG